MTFLEPLMLIGLAAVSVPILIHLLNRRKARVVDWGAMRFLLDSLISRNRRIMIEELLLMILRCLILALLALAMARMFLPSASYVPWFLVFPLFVVAAVAAAVAAAIWPNRRRRWKWLIAAATCLVLALGLTVTERILQSARWGGQSGARDVVILVDGSMSMKRVIDGKTNFARAVEEARDVIQSCQPADAVGVILAGSVPRALLDTPTADRREIDALLRDKTVMAAGDGSMHAPDAVAAAVELLARGRNPGKLIVLITDGQDLGWDAENPTRWQYLAESMTGFVQPPRLIVRTLAEAAGFRNAAVTDVTFSSDVIGPRRPVEIDVKVSNTGAVPLGASTVTLSLEDGEVLSRELGEIKPGAAETVRFEYTFSQGGPQPVTARVQANDDLPADDVATRVVNVVQKLPVLVIDGAPSNRPLEGASDFLAVALAPKAPPEATAGGQQAEEYSLLLDPTVVTALEVDQIENLSSYRMVLLADVPLLPKSFAERLEQFVGKGGGLLIVPGTHVEPSFYNLWKDSSGRPVPPAEFVQRVSRPDEPDRFSLETFSHPALTLVADTSQSDADQATATGLWRMTVNEADPSVRVGARLSSGEPLLVERQLGDGFVLMLSTALDGTDSNLPRLRCFVPFVQGLARYLAAPSTPHLNVLPAKELLADLPVGTDVTSGAGGLVGEYFLGTDLKNLKMVRVDPGVNFRWGDASPHKLISNDSFSVRWTGLLTPSRSGEYTIHTLSDDGVRVSINGKRLIDDWTHHALEEHTATIRLKAGRKYPFEMEYFENTGGAEAQLLWSAPGLARQPIPARAFSPSPKHLRRLEGTGSLKMPQALAENRAKVISPTGKELPAHVTLEESVARLKVSGAAEPGVYEMVLSGAVESRIPLVVLGDPAESRIDPIADDRLGRIGNAVSLFRARSTSEMTTAVAGGVPGEELWKWLALTMLLCIVGEVALTRWITIRRKGHAVETVAFESDATTDMKAYRARARELLKNPQEEAVLTK